MQIWVKGWSDTRDGDVTMDLDWLWIDQKEKELFAATIAVSPP